MAGLQTTSYVYSSRGELLEVDLPDNRIITYVHDPMGRRIAKKIDGIIVEKYLWAGMTQLLAVYDASNALIMRFDGARMTRSGSTYYLVTDQVGTVRAVVDTAGAIVKRIDYDSFGNILTDTNPTFTIPFGFAGGLHDRDTGLIRFGARDYDPDSGRWTAKDPIGFAGGDTNLYGYCLADPINFTDGNGLAVGEPGFLEGLLPVWGSGRAAVNNFEEGRYFRGSFDTILAVSDVFLVKAAITAGVKAIGGTAIKLGGHSWPATRAWLGKIGVARPFQHMHHWLIPQSGWGELIPNWIKNQPFNIMPMKSPEYHRALHGIGTEKYSFSARLWLGMPSWVKALISSLLGHEALALDCLGESQDE